jgi:hypothetical protein
MTDHIAKIKAALAALEEGAINHYRTSIDNYDGPLPDMDALRAALLDEMDTLRAVVKPSDPYAGYTGAGGHWQADLPAAQPAQEPARIDHIAKIKAALAAGPEIAMARKAVRCLQLEVTASIAADVSKHVEAAVLWEKP